MKAPLYIGDRDDGERVYLPLEALLRHGVALGASGSGKTVACKAIVEEVVRKGLPVIAVDPQGDIASLGLMGDPDAMQKMGVDPGIAKEYFERLDLKVWTPGSESGIPISMAPSLAVEGAEKWEDKISAFGSVGAALASIAGMSRNAEEATVAFSMILEYADEHDLIIEDLGDFIKFLNDPPLPLQEKLDPVFDKKARAAAEKALRVKTMGANRLAYDLGSPIHVDTLFGLDYGGAYDNGKTRVSVIYLNTLGTQEEKEIFVALLANSVYQWMLEKPSSTPVGLFYMDEVAPYIPPVKKPASKHALMMLLRQARKYGLCCLLASQSPGDIDYKGLGQVGTWLVGKMSTHQEAYKVAPTLRAQPGIDGDSIAEDLPGLNKGRFFVVNTDVYAEPQETQVRWLVSDHKTLSAEEVEENTDEEERRYYR